ncbi:hypothetical protein [Myroides odoratus]|uniref:hypothetical protein n=1 Tax=Myroides odoratus TaxID=256 RepID=UPI000A8E480F|nr:hypothetical protein [Myroides odoratus]
MVIILIVVQGSRVATGSGYKKKTMAEIRVGILGSVSGKVGTVIGANWGGKNIIRGLPRKSSKKATLA